ncbi:hypothetical protein CRS_26760 [Chryseobacterium sp. ON_d1]|nr:hypothetical protein CRS_26760 [Chryseobacterium sp. ON_d1]
MESKKENRKKIMTLHFRNEELYRCGLITFDDYVSNNHVLLIKLKKSIFTDQQSIILFNLCLSNLDLNQFNFYISILRTSSN